MIQVVTLVVTLLAGAIVVTMTCPPVVAIVTVCGIVALSVVVAKAMENMRRAETTQLSRTQKHDASCIGNTRGMARRAKRQGGKTVRQHLKKELIAQTSTPDAQANQRSIE